MFLEGHGDHILAGNVCALSHKEGAVSCDEQKHYLGMHTCMCTNTPLACFVALSVSSASDSSRDMRPWYLHAQPIKSIHPGKLHNKPDLVFEV
jgi:hypothetical protein